MKTLKLAFYLSLSVIALNSCEKSSTYSNGVGNKTSTINTNNSSDLVTQSRIDLLTANRGN